MAKKEEKPRLSKDEVRVLTNVANTNYLLIRDKAVDAKVIEILYAQRVAIKRILRAHGYKSLNEKLHDDHYAERNEWPDTPGGKWEAIK